MKYDFDKIIDRKGSNSTKYDFMAERGKKEDILPLWVADMDFQTAQPIRERLGKIVEHGIFGYSAIKEDYTRSVQNWYQRHFNWRPEGEWLVQTPGVVCAISMAVRTFTSEGDAVLIQPPVYYPFRNSIENNNRTVVESGLEFIDGHYEINFTDFETKIKENDVKMFIFCSPHNPVGRVWKAWEQKKITEICKKYGVIIVADEIHCDFTFPGFSHHMLAEICSDYSEFIVTCTAPSKTFNLAGLQVSNIFIRNSKLREAFILELRNAGICHLNVFGNAACQAAYESGEEWLAQVKEYLAENLTFVRDYLKERIPEIKLVEPEGTYLLWFDCRELGLSDEELEKLIVEDAGLWLDAGTMFGPEGRGFERVNIACPRRILQKALEQLEKAIRK